MTETFDIARSEIDRHLDGLDHDIAEARGELDRLEWERVATRRELAAMDRARELLTVPIRATTWNDAPERQFIDIHDALSGSLGGGTPALEWKAAVGEAIPPTIRPLLIPKEYCALFEKITAAGNAGVLLSDLEAAGITAPIPGCAVRDGYLTCQNTDRGIRYWLPRKEEAA